MTPSDTQYRLPVISQSPLRSVENATSYPYIVFDRMGKGGIFYDIVVCKATFDLSPGVLRHAEKMTPIEMRDRYWNDDDIASSSLRVANDLALHKPATDILITGSARVYDGRPCASWEGGIRVDRYGKPLVEHAMRILGPRVWQHRWLRGWKLATPVTCEAVALRHELAYGGLCSDEKPVAVQLGAASIANPVGCGNLRIRELDRSVTYAAPQLELIGEPIKALGITYGLAAPAPLACFWPDRSMYVGSNDGAWQALSQSDGVADFPPTFDSRYYQCALPSLRCVGHLEGDERLHLTGMLNARSSLSTFILPGIRLHAGLIGKTGDQQRPLVLDTVHIDLDKKVIELVWRLTLDRRDEIDAIYLSSESSIQ